MLGERPVASLSLRLYGQPRLPFGYHLPSMEGWVAVTHSDWFDFLARQLHREEVNFWSPSDYYAFHGTPGAPFSSS